MLGTPPSGFRHASTAATPLSPERMGRGELLDGQQGQQGEAGSGGLLLVTR